MKTLYRINWQTKDIETATLLDEHNINEGASRETWLCKDSNGRKFTCSKNYYKLSELEAWQEYEQELAETCESESAEIAKLEFEHEKTMNDHTRAKKKILSLTGKH